MVRVIDAGIMRNSVQYVEFSGLSTDEKPTGKYATGSVFLEVDTTDVYFYDEDSETWLKAGGE